ncbi:MAG: PqqD family protein [Cyclobacteriaceae bacterium]|nr:PqqD family protein [Cyclobacteriaceae bacterium]
MKIKANIANSQDGFVFDPTTGDSFSLNQTGIEIIEMMKQNLKEEEIKSTILEKYDIDSNILDRFYLDFLSMLKQFNLVDLNG